MVADCLYRAVGAPALPGSAGAGLSGSCLSGCSRGGSATPAPETPGDDVPWVRFLSMAGAWQNNQDRSGSAGSTGRLPALLGRFCTSWCSEPRAHHFPGHRPGAQVAELLHTWAMQWVPGSAPFLGCWVPRGDHARCRVRMGRVCPRQSQRWARHPRPGGSGGT